MGLYDDEEKILLDDIKHGYDHHDPVDKITIYEKTQIYGILACMSIVEKIIEDSPVCYVAQKVAEAMVTEMTVHATANVVELFVQRFLVL